MNQGPSPELVYAFAYEAFHAHGAGRTGEIPGRLLARVSDVPRENLQRWEQWTPLIADTLGAKDEAALDARHELGAWTGEAGDAAGALDLFQLLLPDRVEVLGPRHPDTLTTQQWIDVLRSEVDGQ